MSRLAVACWLGILAAGCPSEFAIDENPKIEVAVDGDIMPDDSTGTTSFPSAEQLQVVKEVTITNPGDAALTLTSVDWKARSDGGKEKNAYVELDIGNLTFPFEIAPNSEQTVELNVIFTPPPGGGAIDDFSNSILSIASNAKDQLGQNTVPVIEVTFAMTKNACIPLINPPNYTFNNATPTSPENQIFCIEQDPQASGECVINSIALASPSPVYQIVDQPTVGTVLAAPSDPTYEPECFTVRYTPTGGDNDPTNNSVLVSIDTQSLTASLKASSVTGSYSLSHSNAEKFDFSNISVGGECRSVIVMSEGPGPLKVSEPYIDPVEARPDFKVTGYIPATTPEGTKTTVDSWPRGLAQGKSIEIELCYEPQGSAEDSRNGDLVIPIGTPAAGQIVLDVFAGTPRPFLDIAPKSNAISVSADVTGGETGVRHVVLYNLGNADLEVVGATIRDKFNLADGVVFTIVSPTDFSTPIPAGGLMLMEISYDSSNISLGQTSASEILKITTVNGFTQSEVTDDLLLDLNDTGGVAIPVANPGTYDNVTVGEPVYLSPAESTAGDGSFPPSSPWARWYLTGKPAGSLAELNAEDDGIIEFTPDVAGDYTVELAVYSVSGGDYWYSAPASVTLSASAP